MRFSGRMLPFAARVRHQSNLLRNLAAGCHVLSTAPVSFDKRHASFQHVAPNRSLSTASSIPPQNNSSFDRDAIKGPHGSYAKQYDLSISNPERFWSQAADSLHWYTKPKTILNQSEENPNFYQWFPDGVINTCYNCLDVHVQHGRAEQDALIYDSPLTGVKETYTYQDLLDHVSTFAGALTDLGIQKGDRVVIYMPMIPEAIISMLACTRIGAVC